MKKASIVGLSANQKLIVAFQSDQNYVQTRFQGFQISADVRIRPFFDDLMNKQIQCSFNKNEKTLRYQNQSLFTRLLHHNAVFINKKQLDQSKLFTEQQKITFYQLNANNVNQNASDSSGLAIDFNLKSNSSVVYKFVKEKTTIKAKIEYFSEHLLICFNHEGKKGFLRAKLNSYKHYFQLFPQTTFWKSKLLPVQLQITFMSQKYNILTKSNDLFIDLSSQIAEKILSQGWIALNQKNYFESPRQAFKGLVLVQKESIKQQKGIYSSKSQILSFIYAKNNYVGTITKVIEGYIYEITALKTKQTSKVELPMVVCPIGEDAGSYQCRQFARKQLIGKQVNVYLHKQEGLNTAGNIIRIQDWKDVESILLENGAAVVRQQLRNSILGQKYTGLQNKAREKKKGLHTKHLGNVRFQDLTQALVNKSRLNTYSPRRYQILNKLAESQAAVIQEVTNPLNYKVRIQSLQIMMNVNLQGVKLAFFNPNLKQQHGIRAYTDKFLKQNFFQRNVLASIRDYDQQSNSFVGTLYLEDLKVDLQQVLIKESLVYADKYNFNPRYTSLQSEAKKSEKLIWQPLLRCFEPGHQLDKEKFCFEGRFSWIKDGKIAYIQPKDNFGTVQKLQNQIREGKLQILAKDQQKIGAWCAAPYEGDYYRAVIKAKKDNQVTVEFFDWGNQQSIQGQQLRKLPEQLLYTQRQSIRVNLNLVAKTRNKDAVQKVRQVLFQGGVYVFKKLYGDLVDIFSSQTTSVNEQLVRRGLLKADKYELKRYENKQALAQSQDELRKQRIGIWQDSQSSSEEQTENY